MRNRLISVLLVGSVLSGSQAFAQDVDVIHVVEAALRGLRDIQIDEGALRQARENAEQAATRLRDQFRFLKIRPIPPLPRAPELFGSLGADQSGADQMERFSRRLKLERNGSVSVSNISGDIVVTAGSGDEVSIDAVKRSHDRSLLGDVQVRVEEFAGRIDVRTDYPRYSKNVNVSVDYMLTVPSWAAVEPHSISGSVRVTGVQGVIRAETISGNLLLNDTPKLQSVKSVSGRIELSGAVAGEDLTASTVSGDVLAKGVKARSLTINTVSGRVRLMDVTTDHLAAKSISGDVAYAGSLTKGGRYNINSHSGAVRLTLNMGTGFELDATSFSGSIHSDLPLTLRGDIRTRGPRNSLTQATFGDGSAALTIRTFSGDIIITK